MGRRPLSVLWAIIQAKNLGRAKLRLSREWRVKAELRSQELQEFRMGRRPLSVLWAIIQVKNLGRAKLRLSRECRGIAELLTPEFRLQESHRFSSTNACLFPRGFENLFDTGHLVFLRE